MKQMNVAPQQTECKCCFGMSRLSGVVDFSKSCADRGLPTRIEACLGVPVYYFRCDDCGFVFTRAMDNWTSGDFASFIYNDDYVRHDPDFLGKRPRDNASLIIRNFPDLAKENMLDFGSGLGLLEKELKAQGFESVDSYDPYARGQDKLAELAPSYKTVVSFEVFEHHPQPHELMSNLKRFLAEEGTILFSTLLINDSVMSKGIENWWYCAPRNGHISLFTPKALVALGQRHGLKLSSFGEGLHFFHNGQIPDWARKFRRTDH